MMGNLRALRDQSIRILTLFLLLTCTSAAAVSENEELTNPSAKSSRHLSSENFVNPYVGREQQYFGVDKANYKTALKYADSGYAHDAFMASMAYWSGHYKARKKNISFGKGRNQAKSLRYLHLASDLGWAEASYLLYQCYRDGLYPGYSYQPFRSQVRPIPAGNVFSYAEKHGGAGGCIHSPSNWKEYTNDTNFVLSASNQKAKKYLERAAKQGESFNRSFQQVDSEIPYLDRLDSRINMIIAQLRFQSLMFFANEHAKKSGQDPITFSVSKRDRRMYQEDASSCEEVHEIMLIKSAYEDKYFCGRANADGQFCPGQNYEFTRNTLDACMVLAETPEAWDYYFNERLHYVHPYFDGKQYAGRYKLFDKALAHYNAENNQEKVEWVHQIVKEAQSNEASLTGRWKAVSDTRYANFMAKRNADLAAEEERKRLGKIKEQQIMAINDAEEAAAKEQIQNSQWRSDGFMDQMQEVQDETMQDINEYKIAAQKEQEAAKREQAAERAQQAQVAANNGIPLIEQTCAENGGRYNRDTDKCEKVNQTRAKNSSTYEAEKQNCLNAGKKWTGSSCDYSSTVVIEGWKNGNRTVTSGSAQAAAGGLSSSGDQAQFDANAEKSDPSGSNQTTSGGGSGLSADSSSGGGGANFDNYGPRLTPVFVQKESDNSWATEEDACTHAKSAAIRKAKADCKEQFGGRTANEDEIGIPVDANCHSYRQMEESTMWVSKGEWKATSGVILQCRLPEKPFANPIAPPSS